MIRFLGRCLGFLCVIGIAGLIATRAWSMLDLDLALNGADRTNAIMLFQNAYYATVICGPIVCALLEGLLRRSGVFAAGLAVGALIAAPFALAHALG